MTKHYHARNQYQHINHHNTGITTHEQSISMSTINTSSSDNNVMNCSKSYKRRERKAKQKNRARDINDLSKLNCMKNIICKFDQKMNYSSWWITCKIIYETADRLNLNEVKKDLSRWNNEIINESFSSIKDAKKYSRGSKPKSENQTLKCMYANVRGLYNKI